jgi:hypothetical protein
MQSMLPALPILKIEPALPMLMIEPALPMLKTEPALPMLMMLPTLPMLKMLNKLLMLGKLGRPPIRTASGRNARLRPERLAPYIRTLLYAHYLFICRASPVQRTTAGYRAQRGAMRDQAAHTLALIRPRLDTGPREPE